MLIYNVFNEICKYMWQLFNEGFGNIVRNIFLIKLEMYPRNNVMYKNAIDCM